MSTWAEMRRDETIGRKEPLGVTRRLKPLHAPLALAGGLMRVLCAVVEIAVLTMFYSRQSLPLSSTIALQRIGDDHARHVHQALKQRTEELLCRPLVSAALDQDI
jgi:hypothetical protein